MSYNVSRIKVIREQDFGIRAGRVPWAEECVAHDCVEFWADEWADEELDAGRDPGPDVPDDWPEVNPSYLWEGETPEPDVLLPLTRNGAFYWSGEFSGRSWAMLRELLERSEGSADLLVIWEGGDSIRGVRVVDGVYSEHEVEFSLVPLKDTEETSCP